MHVLGLQASDAALKGLFRSFDRDGSGAVDFGELNERLKQRSVSRKSLLLLVPSKSQRTLKPGQQTLVAALMTDAQPRTLGYAPAAAPPSAATTAYHLPHVGMGISPTKRTSPTGLRAPPSLPALVSPESRLHKVSPTLSASPSLKSVGRTGRFAREMSDDLEWFRCEVLGR
jgi:hypothetical protein